MTRLVYSLSAHLNVYFHSFYVEKGIQTFDLVSYILFLLLTLTNLNIEELDLVCYQMLDLDLNFLYCYFIHILQAVVSLTNFFQNTCGISVEEKQLSVSGRNWGEVDLNGW